MFKKFVLFLCLAFCFKPLFADSLTPEIAAYADAGVRAIYRLDFEDASKNINAILDEHPDYPLALFGNTMIEWSRFEYEYEKSNKEQAKVFEKSINQAIDGIKQWLKTNEEDAQAYLSLGGLYGIKARFDLANKNYVKAYFAGKKGLKFMNKAAKIDPQMYDAYLGEAIYQYYAGTLPAVVKVLAKLVASGDADKGIEYLNMIKEKGRFSADTATLLLVEISVESEKYYNPELADKYIKEILSKYPQNPLYNFVAIITAYENKRYDEVYSAAQDFLNNIGKKPLYKDIYIARSYTAMGTARMAQGRYEEAAELFAKSIEATKGQEMSRWQLYNVLRLAECNDILGRRELAVALYKEVINSKENWGMDDVAKKYLKHPYTADIPLGRMSPP